MALPSAKKRKIFDSRYEVLSIVGRGLDSVVYHAKHLSGEQQEVALKVLINNKPKSSITERLRKEALTLVSCRHKYVVRLDDFHSVADLCYLSMEYAPLGDLRKYITNQGAPLPPELGAEFLRQSLEGMEFIHATGVLHRDLKPDNILVLSDNEIRLADFGLALLPGDELDLEELQNGVGTLSYLPPEMLDGQFYDSRSDLYSLGVCFYEALAGEHPFERAPLSEQKEVRLDKNIKPLHELNPLIPKHLSAVVATLMRYSADARFQTAMEALRALANPDFSGKVSSGAPNSLPNEIDQFPDESTNVDADYNLISEDPANNDETDSQFTDIFDDFFKDTERTAKPTTDSNDADSQITESKDPSNNDTQEMTAHRVQQLIEQDAKNEAASSTRRDAHRQESAGQEERDPIKQESVPIVTARQDFKGPLAPPSAAKTRTDPIGALLTIPPFARPLVVGTGAALLTIALVLLSHVKPSEILSYPSSAPESPETFMEDDVATESSRSTVLTALPAGMYAGSIQGVLPGTTSPLALIVRPEQNTITVVVGIEGWTPATVSTVADAEGRAPTLVVRSNSVLLNMDGQLSDDELTGTFSNAITGETGVWRAKKIS